MRKSFAVTVFSALTVSGCLFESKSDKTFRVYLSGRVDSIYARGADGARAALMGLGIEAKGGDSLPFDYFEREPIPDSAVPGGTILPGSFIIRTGEGYYRMTLWRDSTFLMRSVSPHYMAQFADPYKEFGTAYRGTPCRFSRPEGYHWGPAGHGDTVRLVFSGIQLTLAADSLRLSLILDSAASEDSDPRVNLAGRPWVYASARVSCPEP